MIGFTGWRRRGAFLAAQKMARDFQGIRASGKKVAFEGIVVDRIVDGKMVEHWSNVDPLSLMKQIGAIPA